MGSSSSLTEKKKVNASYEVDYKGEITGLGVKFKMTINKENHPLSILGGSLPTEGIMIISENFKEIRVYEKELKGKNNFYKLIATEDS